MATGTGNLPHDGMDFTPFDILTAEEMDDLVENIESLADGSGIGDEAIGTSTLAQSAVTPEKRGGGYKVGTFTFPGSTGNFSVTGVGFKPKLVEFIWMPTSATATAHGIGHMDEDGNQTAVTGFGSAASSRVDAATDRCIITTSGTARNREATFVSVDADGFTINVTSTSGTADFSYRAYA